MDGSLRRLWSVESLVNARFGWPGGENLRIELGASGADGMMHVKRPGGVVGHDQPGNLGWTATAGRQRDEETELRTAQREDPQGI